MRGALHSLALALLAASALADDGLALVAAKAVVCPTDADAPQAITRAVVLVADGRIEAVGRQGELAIPDGYERVDVGESWLIPGMIDLHSHVVVNGFGDINDTVYQSNPGQRVSPSFRPGNAAMRMYPASGVTTALLIPGSGSNVGGQGVLVKTGFDTYEECLLREPGSLKVAQGDNPTRWGYGMGRGMMSWVIRDTYDRGTAYANEWLAYEASDGEGAPPERNVQFDVFRALVAGEAQISTHTQIPHLVYSTLRQTKQERDLPVYLDHSTVGGWRYGWLARELGVPAICGPRSVDQISRGQINWARSVDEGVRGVAAGYQAQGHDLVGFNTDAPVIPAESLHLQAAMGVRYGFDDSEAAAVRGLTIVPAIAAGIEDKVGSLEAGKHADVVVITGHPADPRSVVERCYIEGRLVYDNGDEEARRY